jgi:hypothetical protein
LTYLEISVKSLSEHIYIFVAEAMDVTEIEIDQKIVPGKIGDQNWFWVDPYKIFPNRFNPNRMSQEKSRLLEKGVEKGNYDPITIAPMNDFYSQRVLNSLDLEETIGTSVNPLDSFIICDGQHRHEKVIKLDIRRIKAHVWRMTETQAMRYFHQRQSVHGEHDPFKEGELFQYEMKENGLSVEKIVEDYCLVNKQYVTLRMELVKEISEPVRKLFYQSFDDKERWPGNLTVSHLGVIKGLTGKNQGLIALGILEKNFSVATTTAVIKKIKLAKTERRSFDLDQLTKEEIFPHIFDKKFDVSSLPSLNELMKRYSRTFFNEVLPKLRQTSISEKPAETSVSDQKKRIRLRAFEGKVIDIEANNFLDGLIVLNVMDDSGDDVPLEELLKKLNKNIQIASEDSSPMNLLLLAFRAMQLYLRKRGR